MRKRTEAATTATSNTLGKALGGTLDLRPLSAEKKRFLLFPALLHLAQWRFVAAGSLRLLQLLGPYNCPPMGFQAPQKARRM